MTLDWKNLLNTKRLRPSTAVADPWDGRTEFEKDYGRIIFSSAFRRLQAKTQVFPHEAEDYARTRLTHSLEVGAIGRSLGATVAQKLEEEQKVVWRNVDPSLHARDVGQVVENACVLHDLGNPPFGHAGERAIGEWAKDKLSSLEGQEREDLQHFEGNAQGFRIATRLQNDGEEYGLNLTVATLSTFLKYPCSSAERDKTVPARKKFGYFKSDKVAFEKVRAETGLSGYVRHPLTLLLEAADDIAYSVCDIEDALHKRAIEWETVVALLSDAAKKNNDEAWLQEKLLGREEKLRKRQDSHEARHWAFRWFRAIAVGRMVTGAARAFVSNYDAIMDGSYQGALAEIMEHSYLCKAFKVLGETSVYSHREVVMREAAGAVAIRGLLTVLLDSVEANTPLAGRLTSMPPKRADDPTTHDLYSKAQRVADYVSGMTDRYAIGMHQRLTGVSL